MQVKYLVLSCQSLLLGECLLNHVSGSCTNRLDPHIRIQSTKRLDYCYPAFSSYRFTVEDVVNVHVSVANCHKWLKSWALVLPTFPLSHTEGHGSLW